MGAVAGQERDVVHPDGADRDRGAGLTVGGVRIDCAGVRPKEGVEAAAADPPSMRPLLCIGQDALVASFAQWVSGARPRTLPNAIAPVVAGTGAAAWLHAAVWWKALLALAVAVALVIGVNYANDYSDGIRGTDDDRVGPVRLVGSRLATPRSVLTAAMTSLALGALAGLVLALLSAPWLIAVGAICIAGAWLYTGGSKPYGYAGFGELAVFVFFGPVAVLGTQYTQALRVDWVGLAQAVAAGALSCSVLVANNLRDIPTDARADKITLAVRLGDARTRMLYQGLLAVAGVLTFVLMLATPWCGGLGGRAFGAARCRTGAIRARRARADPGTA